MTKTAGTANLVWFQKYKNGAVTVMITDGKTNEPFAYIVLSKKQVRVFAEDLIKLAE